MAPQIGFIPHNKKNIDIEQMKRFYYEYKWDYKKIADFFGFKSKSAIYDRFKKLGLKPRTNTDLKTGFKHSDTTKKKISKKLTGRHYHTEEWKRKLSEKFTGKNNPMFGKVSHNYKGGYIRKDGYKMLDIKGKKILEHRNIWIKNFGEIKKGYEVHHINEIKLDNRIENLILLSKEEHGKLHDKLRKRNKGQFSKK